MAILNLEYFRRKIRDGLHNQRLSNTTIDEWVNIAQDRIVRSMDPDYLIEEKSFVTAANQYLYNIETGFAQLTAIVDSTNNRILPESSIKEIRERDPERSDTGTPCTYAIKGQSKVKLQPSSDSVLTAVSTSAADTTQILHITGELDGVRVTDDITLTGTVTSAGSVTMDTVHAAELDTACAGIVTVTSNAAAVTIVKIPANELSVIYQSIELYEIPSGAFTYHYLCMRNPRPLVNASDTPDLPNMYHDAVLLGAMVQGHDEQYEHDLSEIVNKKFEDAIQKLHNQQGVRRNQRRPKRISSKHPRDTAKSYNRTIG